MISVNRTSTDEAMFGSSSVNMIRIEPAPCAVAASTNSFRAARAPGLAAAADVGDEDERDDQIGIQRLAAGDVDRPVVEAVDRERRAERDPEQDDRERPDQVEEARDDPVDDPAEVAGEQREDHRQNRADRGRGDADEERVAAAVEQPRAMSRPSSSAPRMYLPPAAPHWGPIGMPPNTIFGSPFTIFVPPWEMTSTFFRAR